MHEIDSEGGEKMWELRKEDVSAHDQRSGATAGITNFLEGEVEDPLRKPVPDREPSVEPLDQGES